MVTDYHSHYVYAHREVDGQIVYLGHGKGGRAWIYGSRKTVLRSPEHLTWIHEQDSVGRLPCDYVEILGRGLSKPDAAQRERQLIEKFQPRFNKQQGVANLKITPDILGYVSDLRKEGATYEDIGKSVGLSDMTVFRALNNQTKSVNKWKV